MALIIRLLAILAGAGGTWLLARRILRDETPLTDPEVNFPEEPVSARRIAETETVIQWGHVAESALIYMGTSPETIDRTQAITTAVGIQETRVTVPDANTRYFFEIVLNDDTTFITAERIIPLSSVQNLRDIGGYVTQSGQRVLWNRVYRAASLGQITADDLKTLEAMNVRVVCDLRSDDEAIHQPDRVPKGAKYLHLPVQDNGSRMQRGLELLFGVRGIAEYMQLMYTRIMLDEHVPVLRTIFEQLADEKQLPLLVHCSAGKDRTGITVALLLRFLGATDETIIADYALSNLWVDYFREITQPYLAQMARYGVTERDLQPAIIADVANIQATLDYIDRVHGSVEEYLRLVVGLDTLVLRKIRQNLLEAVIEEDTTEKRDTHYNDAVRRISVDIEFETDD